MTIEIKRPAPAHVCNSLQQTIAELKRVLKLHLVSQERGEFDSASTILADQTESTLTLNR
jgi:hypothetical protein